MMSAQTVVLASASPVRALLLERAGVMVHRDPARVDEAEVKHAFRAAGLKVQDVAVALAETKAERVSRRHPGALVIGADQMLDCEGTWFDKPADMAEARAQLAALRGRTHRLWSAVVVALDGSRIWHHLDGASLTMRPFTDAFLDRYLETVGAAVQETVGGYQLEGLGAQLFARIAGNYFTILGLPLLPLLDFLRVRGVLET